MSTIADTYRRTRKIPDLFWNRYVCRPVAAVLVHALRDSAVTPNQITLASVVVALGAMGILVGVPGYVGLVAAVGVYEVSYVLDCADGMLARLRGVQSTSGHLLDFLMDEIKAYGILGAVAIRLFLQTQDARYLMLGILGLAALATGIGLTTFLRRPEIAPPAPPTAPRSAGPFGRVLRAVEGVAKLLIHYPSYILLVALAGHIEWYFFPYIAVNCLYAARSLAQVALRFGKHS